MAGVAFVGKDRAYLEIITDGIRLIDVTGFFTGKAYESKQSYPTN
jgi:hypothetical protein